MTRNMTQHPPFTPPQSRRPQRIWGAALTGFAIGGFFDGILLHQILQWHHLLSGVTNDPSDGNLRFQILMDGLFHLSHYILGLTGLWLLWRSRGQGQDHWHGRHSLPGWACIGFGTWHMMDAVVSHWWLQIHRIRMDVDNPLLWDLLWVIPFGVGVTALGLWLITGRAPPAPPTSGTAPVVATILSLIAISSGVWAAMPPSDLPSPDRTLVVFRPGLSFPQIEAAVASVGGRLVWTDIRQGVWLIAHEPSQSMRPLYRRGAWMMSDGAIAVGCLSYTRV